MVHTEIAPILDDTEEAPWMVMGTSQWEAANDFYDALSVHAHTLHPPLFVAAMLPIRYRPVPSSRIEQLAPDVMVAAVPLHARQSYDIEQEGAAPLFVLEVVSPQSQHRDRVIKPQRYELMGVLEYALFDPSEEGKSEASLEGYRRDGESERFVGWEPDEAGRLHSEQLGLWLAIKEEELRLQRSDGSWLPTIEESEAARAAAEAETERLRAELERYRRQ